MPAFVRVGPGDDAAVLDVSGPVVASTDTLVQARDFRLDWSTGHDVGVKTAAQSFADIAAMGARPLALLVSLSAPGGAPTSFAGDLANGLDDECRRAGAAVVGGDVSAADEIVVTGTAIGVLDGRAVLRSGARVGDVVALAGRTGPSAAGLALLQAGLASGVAGPDHARLVTAHRAPRPGYAAGPVAALAGATAMIDTSDGLLRDAARIGAASGVTLDLDPSALTPGADLAAAALDLGDPALALRWVLTGGEDHALLACFPAQVAVPPPFRVIGRCVAPDGTTPSGTVLLGGRPHVGPSGWTHWS
jgi:thiamine-monophosphate kinase